MSPSPSILSLVCPWLGAKNDPAPRSGGLVPPQPCAALDKIRRSHHIRGMTLPRFLRSPAALETARLCGRRRDRRLQRRNWRVHRDPRRCCHRPGAPCRLVRGPAAARSNPTPPIWPPATAPISSGTSGSSAPPAAQATSISSSPARGAKAGDFQKRAAASQAGPI